VAVLVVLNCKIPLIVALIAGLGSADNNVMLVFTEIPSPTTEITIGLLPGCNVLGVSRLTVEVAVLFAPAVQSVKFKL
jgi:hypothetical protein